MPDTQTDKSRAEAAATEQAHGAADSRHTASSHFLLDSAIDSLTQGYAPGDRAGVLNEAKANARDCTSRFAVVRLGSRSQRRVNVFAAHHKKCVSLLLFSCAPAEKSSGARTERSGET